MLIRAITICVLFAIAAFAQGNAELSTALLLTRQAPLLPAPRSR